LLLNPWIDLLYKKLQLLRGERAAQAVEYRQRDESLQEAEEMNTTETPLRSEVRQLAEEAFHLKLISGYGDGQYGDKYQIVYNGKPKHYTLECARFILKNLITNRRENHWRVD
jgi:hypothetical protein